MSRILFAIAIGMSFAAFLLMGLDKSFAKAHSRRIPEKVLFLFAILFGAVGGTLGMVLFHHKTRHFYFALGFPLLAVLQLVLLFLL